MVPRKSCISPLACVRILLEGTKTDKSMHGRGVERLCLKEISNCVMNELELERNEDFGLFGG
jgi:hypothetical protein